MCRGCPTRSCRPDSRFIVATLTLYPCSEVLLEHSNDIRRSNERGFADQRRDQYQ